MFRPALAALFLFATPLQAEVPRIAVDIAPVYGLVEQVLGDLGRPDLVIRPGALPHDFALRPSQAAVLEQADLVIWVGPGLTPWLEDSLETLAGDADQLRLLEVEGTRLLEMREGANFAGHEDAAEHEGEGEGEPDSGSINPHAWLDPENARIWLLAIADALADADPRNARTYLDNAEAAANDLGALVAEVDAQLAPVRDARFVVLHDAYHYFEDRFGLQAIGAIADGEATPPGAARIMELLEGMADGDVACLFYEPQSDINLAYAVLETGLPTASLDPLGMSLLPEPDFYTALIRDMADTALDCLSDS